MAAFEASTYGRIWVSPQDNAPAECLRFEDTIIKRGAQCSGESEEKLREDYFAASGGALPCLNAVATTTGFDACIAGIEAPAFCDGAFAVPASCKGAVIIVE
jgi:hypothetical protein